MNNILLYSINIAMEATMVLLLVIILITLLWQKKLFITTVPLIFLSVFIILTTIVQIVTWILLILNVPFEYSLTPMRIIYTLDTAFSYGATAAFYYYVEALVIDRYEHIGVTFKPNKHIKKIIVGLGIAITLFFLVAVFMPSFYRVENGKEVYSIVAYIVLHIETKFAIVCALVFIIRHRKVIGKHEVAVSIVFFILLSVFFIVDELYYICIGRVLLALFVFIIYVSIDLHKGLLLERQEKEIVEWKTQIMLSQMQPHFLYNVFTTISSLCEMENAYEARDVVNRFADYFRANLDSLGKEKTISFEKELEHIKTYLWLEKIRFEDSLNICYEIETTDFEVPSLAVQPMVENAVKHGIHPKDDAGTVTIRTYETSLDYVIIVQDDGVGFDINENMNDNRTHVGIENVRNRLKMICNASLQIRSEKGKGTIVTIQIPKRG